MDAGFADQCGLSVTCKSRKALELYNTVIELFISQTEEFVSSLKNILEQDPDFVLARCLLVSIINIHVKSKLKKGLGIISPLASQ